MAETATIKAVLANSVPKLSVAFGEKDVAEPGQYLPRASARTTPIIKLPSGKPGTKYFAISIDLDAPFPSFPILGPIAHWIQHDLTLDPSTGLLTSDAPPISAWAPPGPPPGSSPHKYVFAVYEQPEGFERSKAGPSGEMTRMARMRFDFAGFQERNGLKEVVGGNWFTSN